MKRVKLILLGAVVLFLLALILSYSKGQELRNSSDLPREGEEFCLNGSCFKVAIADTPEERKNGLMFVEEMPEDEGMLFIFEESALHSFWMKNTLIPLDIIWLDEDKNIVFIEKNAQPCKEDPCRIIYPLKPARYVLEINAGLADKLNLGD